MPEQPSINEWRHPEERAELVERIVSLTRRANLAERTLRELTQAATDGEPIGAYIEALQARIAVLEQNIEKLTRKGHRAA